MGCACVVGEVGENDFFYTCGVLGEGGHAPSDGCVGEGACGRMGGAEGWGRWETVRGGGRGGGGCRKGENTPPSPNPNPISCPPPPISPFPFRSPTQSPIKKLPCKLWGIRAIGRRLVWWGWGGGGVPDILYPLQLPWRWGREAWLRDNAPPPHPTSSLSPSKYVILRLETPKPAQMLANKTSTKPRKHWHHLDSAWDPNLWVITMFVHVSMLMPRGSRLMAKRESCLKSPGPEVPMQAFCCPWINCGPCPTSLEASATTLERRAMNH